MLLLLLLSAAATISQEEAVVDANKRLPCKRQLLELCGQVKSFGGSSACLQCCGLHQKVLRSSGCANEDTQLFCYAATAALPLHFPPGVFVDAAEFGATPGGRIDATAALQAAISATVGFHPGVDGHSINVTNKVLLLRPGAFSVSDTLSGQDIRGMFQCYMSLQGSGASVTSIVLSDHSLKFASASNPRAIVFAASCKDAASYAPGNGESAFKNGVFDLTIDVGQGNPGAVALDFIGNNKASIMRVKLVGHRNSGVVGLSLIRPYVGPMLVKSLSVQGFQVGINISNPQCSVTMVNIYLTGQTFAGLVNSQNVLSVEKLRSEQSTAAIPALLLTSAHSGQCPNKGMNVPQGLTSIIDARMVANISESSSSMHVPQSPAIKISCGSFYGRSLSSVGYSEAVELPNYSSDVGTTGPVPRLEKTVDEYVYPAQNVTALFVPVGKSLRLPIHNTPENDTALFSGGVMDWASVCDTRFGAPPTCGNGFRGDDTEWIDRALNSGSRVVFFPAKSFRVTRTIVIRSTALAEMVGMESTIQSVGRFFLPINGTEVPSVFRLELSAPVLTIRQLSHETRGWGCPPPLWCRAIFVEHASASTLVLRHLLHNGVVSRPSLTGEPLGDLFAEDVCCGAFNLSLPQRAWLRQLNIEQQTVHLSVSGGARVWVLGMKTEQAGGEQISVDGTNSAVEVLGAFFMPFKGMQNSSEPAAISVTRGARASFSFAESSFQPAGKGGYRVLVKEESSGGTVRRFNASNAPKRGGGYGTVLPLFSAGCVSIDVTGR
jgi:hypothetical protein